MTEVAPDVDAIAAELASVFIQRRDVKARQTKSGAYIPVTDTGKPDGNRLKFTMGDLRAHLRGEHTFGHYLVSPEGNVKIFAIDVDLNKTGTYTDDLGVDHDINPREVWLDKKHPARPKLEEQLRLLAIGLGSRAMTATRSESLPQGVPSIISYSGSKGVHVYGIVGIATAAEARAMAKECLDGLMFELVRGKNFFGHAMFPDVTVEIYPKQDEVTDLGNLMKLPLGVDRRTGHKSCFLRWDSLNDGVWKCDDPIETLKWGTIR